MSTMDRFARWWQGNKQNNERTFPAWLPSQSKASEWGEFGKDLSYKKAADRYTSSDLIYMCIKRLGDMVADARLVLFPTNAERDPVTGLPLLETALPAEDHPFYDLWRKPNPQDSKAEFLEALATTILLSPKGAFIHLDDGNRSTTSRIVDLAGEPKALWWLLPEPIRVVPGKDNFVEKYVFKLAGETTTFMPAAVIWIKEHNPGDPYKSVSRLQPIDLASTTDIAAQRSDFALFKNAMRPGGIIESDLEKIDPDELKLLEKLWEDRFAGSENWHKLLPLWAGFKFKQLGITPKDAQTDETARRNRMRIFGTLGVHPGIILSEDVNLANAKVAEHVTRAFTLRPLLRRIADAITPILPLWTDAPPAEAHFINVVPEDERAEADIARIKAETSQVKARAIANLLAALGPQAGVEAAIGWQLLPEGTTADEGVEFVRSPASALRYWPGGWEAKQENGHTHVETYVDLICPICGNVGATQYADHSGLCLCRKCLCTFDPSIEDVENGRSTITNR